MIRKGTVLHRCLYCACSFRFFSRFWLWVGSNNGCIVLVPPASRLACPHRQIKAASPSQEQVWNFIVHKCVFKEGTLCAAICQREFPSWCLLILVHVFCCICVFGWEWKRKERELAKAVENLQARDDDVAERRTNYFLTNLFRTLKLSLSKALTDSSSNLIYSLLFFCSLTFLKWWSVSIHSIHISESKSAVVQGF